MCIDRGAALVVEACDLFSAHMSSVFESILEQEELCEWHAWVELCVRQLLSYEETSDCEWNWPVGNSLDGSSPNDIVSAAILAALDIRLMT